MQSKSYLRGLSIVVSLVAFISASLHSYFIYLTTSSMSTASLYFFVSSMVYLAIAWGGMRLYRALVKSSRQLEIAIVLVILISASVITLLINRYVVMLAY